MNLEIIESVIDLIEIGAVRSEDVVKNLRSAIKDTLEQSSTPPQRTEQEPVAWLDGPHLVVRSDMRDRLNYKGPWVDLGRAIPDKWTPLLYTTPPQRTEPKIGCVNHDCDKCKAQTEQEPVAWYHAEDYKTHFTTNPSPDLIGKYWKPLYTTPPQRTWVGSGDLEDSNAYFTKPQRTWVGLTDEDKAILEAVHRELDRNCDEGNAPGHSHRIKGVWDEDNGKLAGKPCAWCLTWAKFTALIKNEAAHGITGEKK